MKGSYDSDYAKAPLKIPGKPRWSGREVLDEVTKQTRSGTAKRLDGISVVFDFVKILHVEI